MKCPRCKKDLLYAELEEQKLGMCKSCSGIWLTKNQLNALFSDFPGDFEYSSVDENDHRDKYPVIKCRKCEDTDMKKINFLEYSKIIIDHCAQCGSFWLDKDELTKMKDYVVKVEEGSHEVKDSSVNSFFTRLSKIAYSIFH